MARSVSSSGWPALEAQISRLERDVEQLRDEIRQLADQRDDHFTQRFASTTDFHADDRFGEQPTPHGHAHDGRHAQRAG